MTPNTASFWLTLLGAILPGRLGAYLWVLCGFGWTGLVWDRAGGAKIRRPSEYKKDQLTLHGLLTHAPQLFLGIWRLERGRKR